MNRDRLPARPLDLRNVPDHVALQHELADMSQRARLGGIFYIAGWITVGLTDDVPTRHPLAFGLGLFAFVALSLLRLRQPRHDLNIEGMRRWLHSLWWIVWLSTALWSLGAAWVVATSDVMTARVLALVLVGAYGTTLSHVYAMREIHAGIGVSLLFVPQLVVTLLRPGERLLGISLLIYLVYLLLVLRRARTEYWQRVALEEEIREQRDYFEQQSRRDGLTGLPNRRRFDATLATLLPDTDRKHDDNALSLILFDLDHFKAVNDQHGHVIGDQCLVHFARCLGETFNATGVLPARLGGEEFAVILPRCGLAEATTKADQLRELLVAQPLMHESTCVTLTVSGGAVSARHMESVDDLLARADAALYRAKRAGRNCVVAADGVSVEKA